MARARKDLKHPHNKQGNCWADKEPGDDVCMEHEEPRGECENCPKCPRCGEDHAT